MLLDTFKYHRSLIYLKNHLAALEYCFQVVALNVKSFIMLTLAGGPRTEEKRPKAKRPSVASTWLPIPDLVKCPLSVALSLLIFSYAISQPIHADNQAK